MFYVQQKDAVSQSDTMKERNEKSWKFAEANMTNNLI
jgi:hypothetical protein